MSASEDRRDAQRDTQLAVMANDITYIKRQLDHIDNQVSNNYVTKEEFSPIKKIVYGMVGLVLTMVMGALLGLVVLK